MLNSSATDLGAHVMFMRKNKIEQGIVIGVSIKGTLRFTETGADEPSAMVDHSVTLYSMTNTTTSTDIELPSEKVFTTKEALIESLLKERSIWRISQLPQGRKQFDALYELFEEIK